MIQLNLTRPIAFFDLETTGVNVASDRIVEISILKISILLKLMMKFYVTE